MSLGWSELIITLYPCFIIISLTILPEQKLSGTNSNLSYEFSWYV
jgi:hypothetical protein